MLKTLTSVRETRLKHLASLPPFQISPHFSVDLCKNVWTDLQSTL